MVKMLSEPLSAAALDDLRATLLVALMGHSLEASLENLLGSTSVAISVAA
jgi:hypothetical protein